MASENAQCSTWCRCWVFKISCKIGVLKQSQPAFLQYYPHNNAVCNHMWWMQEIKRDNSLSQALVHFVIDRASLFTAHSISGRPIRAECKNFRTIWERTFDNSPTDFNSFFFEMMVVNAWSWYLKELLSRVVRQLTISFHTFLDMTFHVIRPRRHTQIFRAW